MKPFCLQIGKKPEHITIRQRAAALEMAIFFEDERLLYSVLSLAAERKHRQ